MQEIRYGGIFPGFLSHQVKVPFPDRFGGYIAMLEALFNVGRHGQGGGIEAPKLFHKKKAGKNITKNCLVCFVRDSVLM
jgi:hypothetical protein